MIVPAVRPAIVIVKASHCPLFLLLFPVLLVEYQTQFEKFRYQFVYFQGYVDVQAAFLPFSECDRLNRIILSHNVPDIAEEV